MTSCQICAGRVPPVTPLATAMLLVTHEMKHLAQDGQAYRVVGIQREGALGFG